MPASPAQNVSGSVTINTSFSETISAGVIVNQNLPTGVNQNISYTNAVQTGAPSTTDLVLGMQKGMGSLPITVNLNSFTDLSGSVCSFQRVRELIIQNLNSFPIFVYASSQSGVTQIIGGSTSTTGITIPGGNSTLGVWPSGIWPMIRLSDPTTSSGQSTAGYFINNSSCNLVVNAATATSANSVNIVAAGCSQS